MRNSQQRDSNSRPPVYETDALTTMLCWHKYFYLVTHAHTHTYTIITQQLKRFGAAVARWAHNPKVRGSKPRIAKKNIYFFSPYTFRLRIRIHLRMCVCA